MTKKRAIIGIIAAIAMIVGVAIFGSNAGATSYDYDLCYSSDCEETTTTEYVEDTTTTEVTTTTVVTETTTTVPVTTTVPELPEPELIPPAFAEQELPPYIEPMEPVEPPVTQTDDDEGENISFAG